MCGRIFGNFSAKRITTISRTACNISDTAYSTGYNISPGNNLPCVMYNKDLKKTGKIKI